MSFSTYTICPSSLLDATSRERMHEPRDIGTPDNQAEHVSPSSFIDPRHLSPFASHTQSNSASPLQNLTATPGESISTSSEQYQTSDFSELDEDPFFGVNFNDTEGGTPTFLEDLTPPPGQGDLQDAPFVFGAPTITSDNALLGTTLPLSPDLTASIHTTSPRSERKSPRLVQADSLPRSISPQQLSKASQDASSVSVSSHELPQLTPDTDSSRSSSESQAVPGAPTMNCPSPRVTVSVWGNDDATPVQSIDAAVHDDPSRVRVGTSADDNFIPPALYRESAEASTTRDETGAWVPDSKTGHRGFDPASRTTEEVASMNELAANRERGERNIQVGDWLSKAESSIRPDAPPVRSDPSETADDGIPQREVSLGNTTENKELPGQTYYLETGGEITREDIEIMRENRNWADAPVMFPITKENDMHYQPESSQAAIERFQRMCQDNDSIVSRAATWGTRRRSLPSIIDFEGITSGNFLKKLSLSRGEPRRQSIFKDIRGLVRKPSTSQILKRGRSDQDEERAADPESENRRESQSSLAPPDRSMSWGKKQPMPSLNTALVSMGANVASIGTTHARSGSISNTTPVVSPKSPFNLAVPVKNRLTRPRSKSELPKGARNANEGSHSNLVDMWKRSGGPPVASLAGGAPMPDQDEDEDDDDDLDEDTEMKAETAKMIDEVTPNFAGFQKQVLRQNPMLANKNNYLVDRIAHQQVVRYKSLLNAKQRHMQHVLNRSCSCGTMCIALGGRANPLGTNGDMRELDPLSAGYEGSDGDLIPLEGAVTPESFPQDIPMPPTSTLPAEFECQLCFQTKKFQKPSDWTKHVHEDVQPFTCTWDRCRDPKIFKRKADWVRHENEGHRHLEWWACDVEDCRHTCYRRDNFLQHLVREHKFPEPKVKTKAAIKRAGGVDPTWQKVEQCHTETTDKPQDEACRFCGKTFPSWKKLTVHLAKHMEQISLPILSLVRKAHIEADTIISPVQDPPPRSFAPFPVKHEPQAFDPSSGMNTMSIQQPQNTLVYPGTQQDRFTYPQVQQVPAHFQQPYYTSNTQFDGLPQNLGAMSLGMQPHMSAGFANQPSAYHGMPVTSGPFVAGPNHYMSAAPVVEPFPAMTMEEMGLQGQTVGGQMSYDAIMDPTSAGADQFTPHGSVHGGSVSPYSHSPHQGPGGFYPH
ncbi:C2H2 finger domain-containing protein [Pleurostoma richardsiae]|uniref:C2H2 finger domain-containing protein n=1 Tax=Pleurostoma richardsiae TaxID=41990 RepID=A0AA38SEZ0_9PEZI|nr:C2H2 finger domain-containing protein [Pleurostoma richardsiae]